MSLPNRTKLLQSLIQVHDRPLRHAAVKRVVDLVLAITGLAPAGGTTGQFLAKNSNTDYDYGWSSGGLAPIYAPIIYVGAPNTARVRLRAIPNGAVLELLEGDGQWHIQLTWG